MSTNKYIITILLENHELTILSGKAKQHQIKLKPWVVWIFVSAERSLAIKTLYSGSN